MRVERRPLSYQLSTGAFERIWFITCSCLLGFCVDGWVCWMGNIGAWPGSWGKSHRGQVSAWRGVNFYQITFTGSFERFHYWTEAGLVWAGSTRYDGHEMFNLWDSCYRLQIGKKLGERENGSFAWLSLDFKYHQSKASAASPQSLVTNKHCELQRC